jgi:CRISPR-associated protein Csm4
MAELDGPVGEMIESFEVDPPFLLTSAFPFVGTERRRHFLPRPILPPPHITEKDLDRVKDYKRARYIDADLFRAWATGRTSAGEIIAGMGSLKERHGLLWKGEMEEFSIQEGQRPHNRVNRLYCGSDAFFSSEGMYFKNAGLYFLLDARRRDYESEVLAALRFLADRGLGGRVSAGMGAFDLSIREVDFLPTGRESHLLTLSRFIPADLNAFGGEISYEIVPVRGRSGDGKVRKSVLTLKEGSVFKNIGATSYGSIERVRDDRPVVEYGMAFPVPFRWSE